MKTIILFTSAILVSLNAEDTIIKTKTGEIKGTRITISNQEVDAFLGIPYAVPPIGNLRFRKPQPITSWNGILDASKKSSACMQIDVLPPELNPSLNNMQEDCLYLNIWVPAQRENDNPLTTMIWIHGGGFSTGSASDEMFDGAVLASFGNVIVASVNYRLGALGFINIGTEEAPGNMGMWDQIEAIRWIHDNIKYFGGDPSDITLFGESAGGISVSNHVLSPVTKGLFKKAIIQSGTNYNPIFTVSPSVGKFMTEDLAKRLGCTNENEDLHKTINCMRNVDASQITHTETLVPRPTVDLVTFVPSYGDEFLPNLAHDLVIEGKFNDVDVMIGNVKDEGTFFLALQKPSLTLEDQPKFNKSEAEEIILSYFKRKDKSSLKKVFDEYLGDIAEDDFASIFHRTYEVMGDSLLKCPIILFADNLIKKNEKTYYYTFNHRVVKNFFKKWLGVIHGEELPFVFSKPLLKPDDYTPEEIELSKTIMELWVSFAKTGTPSAIALKQDWPKYSEGNRSHLHIDTNELTNVQDFQGNKCDFWKNCYKNNDCIN